MKKEVRLGIEKNQLVEALENKKAIKEQFNLRLRELRSAISSLRKEGKDPLIADYMLRNINSKIQWASVNGHEKDFEIIERIMDNAEQEIKDASEKEPVNIKKELEERVQKVIKKQKLSEQPIVEPEPLAEKPIVEQPVEQLVEKPAEEQPVQKELSKDRENAEPVAEKKEKIPDRELSDSRTYFHLHNGGDLKSIKELVVNLSDMPDEEFRSFTKEYDNDFSKWIEFVFYYPELAKKIKGVNNKLIMISILKEEVEV
ncbi:MAG: hypothetical protein ABH828_03350 [archaeon]